MSSNGVADSNIDISGLLNDLGAYYLLSGDLIQAQYQLKRAYKHAESTYRPDEHLRCCIQANTVQLLLACNEPSKACQLCDVFIRNINSMPSIRQEKIFGRDFIALGQQATRRWSNTILPIVRVAQLYQVIGNTVGRGRSIQEGVIYCNLAWTTLLECPVEVCSITQQMLLDTALLMLDATRGEVDKYLGKVDNLHTYMTDTVKIASAIAGEDEIRWKKALSHISWKAHPVQLLALLWALQKASSSSTIDHASRRNYFLFGSAKELEQMLHDVFQSLSISELLAIASAKSAIFEDCQHQLSTGLAQLQGKLVRVHRCLLGVSLMDLGNHIVL
jgi:hypothetical protein